MDSRRNKRGGENQPSVGNHNNTATRSRRKDKVRELEFQRIETEELIKTTWSGIQNALGISNDSHDLESRTILENMRNLIISKEGIVQDSKKGDLHQTKAHYRLEEQNRHLCAELLDRNETKNVEKSKSGNHQCVFVEREIHVLKRTLDNYSQENRNLRHDIANQASEHQWSLEEFTNKLHAMDTEQQLLLNGKTMLVRQVDMLRNSLEKKETSFRDGLEKQEILFSEKLHQQETLVIEGDNRFQKLEQTNRELKKLNCDYLKHIESLAASREANIMERLSIEKAVFDSQIEAYQTTIKQIEDQATALIESKDRLILDMQTKLDAHQEKAGIESMRDDKIQGLQNVNIKIKNELFQALISKSDLESKLKRESLKLQVEMEKKSLEEVRNEELTLWQNDAHHLRESVEMLSASVSVSDTVRSHLEQSVLEQGAKIARLTSECSQWKRASERMTVLLAELEDERNDLVDKRREERIIDGPIGDIKLATKIETLETQAAEAERAKIAAVLANNALRSEIDILTLKFEESSVKSLVEAHDTFKALLTRVEADFYQELQSVGRAHSAATAETQLLLKQMTGRYEDIDIKYQNGLAERNRLADDLASLQNQLNLSREQNEFEKSQREVERSTLSKLRISTESDMKQMIEESNLLVLQLEQSMAAVHEKDSELLHLKTHLQVTESQLTSFREDTHRLEEQIEKLSLGQSILVAENRETKLQAEKQVSNLEITLEQRNSEFDDAQKASDNIANHLVSLKAEYEKQRRTSEMQQKSIVDYMTSHIAQLKLELDEKEVVILEFVESKHCIQEKLLSVEIAFGREQSELELIRDEIKSVEAQRISLVVENEKLTSTNKMVSEEFRMTRDQLQMELEQLKSACDALEREKKDLSIRFQSKILELESELQLMNHVSCDLHQQSSIVDSMTSHIAQLKLELDEKEMIILEFVESKHCIQEKLLSVEIAFGKEQSELKLIRDKIQSVEAQRISLVVENEKLTDTNKMIGEEFRMTRNRLQMELEQLKSACDALEREKKGLSVGFKSKILDLENELQLMNRVSCDLHQQASIVDSMTLHIAQLKLELDEKEMVILELVESKHCIREKLLSVETAFGKEQSELDLIREIIKSIESQRALLVDENDKLTDINRTISEELQVTRDQLQMKVEELTSICVKLETNQISERFEQAGNLRINSLLRNVRMLTRLEHALVTAISNLGLKAPTEASDECTNCIGLVSILCEGINGGNLFNKENKVREVEPECGYESKLRYPRSNSAEELLKTAREGNSMLFEDNLVLHNRVNEWENKFVEYVSLISPYTESEFKELELKHSLLLSERESFHAEQLQCIEDEVNEKLQGAKIYYEEQGITMDERAEVLERQTSKLLEEMKAVESKLANAFLEADRREELVIELQNTLKEALFEKSQAMATTARLQNKSAKRMTAVKSQLLFKEKEYEREISSLTCQLSESLVYKSDQAEELRALSRQHEALKSRELDVFEACRNALEHLFPNLSISPNERFDSLLSRFINLVTEERDIMRQEADSNKTCLENLQKHSEEFQGAMLKLEIQLQGKLRAVQLEKVAFASEADLRFEKLTARKKELENQLLTFESKISNSKVLERNLLAADARNSEVIAKMEGESAKVELEFKSRELALKSEITELESKQKELLKQFSGEKQHFKTTIEYLKDQGRGLHEKLSIQKQTLHLNADSVKMAEVFQSEIASLKEQLQFMNLSLEENDIELSTLRTSKKREQERFECLGVDAQKYLARIVVLEDTIDSLQSHVATSEQKMDEAMESFNRKAGTLHATILDLQAENSRLDDLLFNSKQGFQSELDDASSSFEETVEEFHSREATFLEELMENRVQIEKLQSRLKTGLIEKQDFENKVARLEQQVESTSGESLKIAADRALVVPLIKKVPLNVFESKLQESKTLEPSNVSKPFSKSELQNEKRKEVEVLNHRICNLEMELQAEKENSKTIQSQLVCMKQTMMNELRVMELRCNSQVREFQNLSYESASDFLDCGVQTDEEESNNKMCQMKAEYIESESILKNEIVELSSRLIDFEKAGQSKMDESSIHISEAESELIAWRTSAESDASRHSQLLHFMSQESQRVDELSIELFHQKGRCKELELRLSLMEPQEQLLFCEDVNSSFLALLSDLAEDMEETLEASSSDKQYARVMYLDIAAQHVEEKFAIRSAMQMWIKFMQQ